MLPLDVLLLLDQGRVGSRFAARFAMRTPLLTTIAALCLCLPNCRSTDDAAPPLPPAPLMLEEILDRDLPDRLPILCLLQDRKYDELDARLASFEEAFERDFKGEGKVRRVFGSFEVPDL